jgi:hypothetical protein
MWLYQLLKTLKTNNMKQTAVEWLVTELKKYDSAGLKDQSNYVIEMPTHILTELEEQAKEMEKEQIINAIIISEKEHIIQGNVYPPQFVVDKAKKYYNETFTN